jgi:hypothetical protein
MKSWYPVFVLGTQGPQKLSHRQILNKSADLTQHTNFLVITTVVGQLNVFVWVSVPYSRWLFRRFWGTYCLHLQGDIVSQINPPLTLLRKGGNMKCHTFLQSFLLVKGKSHAGRGHEGPEGEQTYNSTISSTSATLRPLYPRESDSVPIV